MIHDRRQHNGDSIDLIENSKISSFPQNRPQLGCIVGIIIPQPLARGLPARRLELSDNALAPTMPSIRQALKLHPDSLCSAATRVEVDVARPRAGSLVLHYVVTGKITDLRIPPATAATRADELWQHTCFEAFVLSPSGAGYYEFNFAPSTQWAAYRFLSYRRGMRVATEISAPQIQVQSAPDCYALQASLELEGLPMLPHDAGWRLGLAALIEETNGGKSYWALAHPPGKADFHHPDCFVCELS